MNALFQLDEKIFHFFNADMRNSFLDIILPFFSMTSLLVLITFIFLLVYGYYLHKNNENPTSKLIVLILLLGISLGVTNTSTDIIKKIVNRTRPYEALVDVHYQNKGEWKITQESEVNPSQGGTSYVSGHAANTMAFVVVFMILFPKTRYWLLIMPLLVGWSRLYLGKHYPLDVFSGWLLGFTLTILVWSLFRKLLLCWVKKLQ